MAIPVAARITAKRGLGREQIRRYMVISFAGGAEDGATLFLHHYRVNRCINPYGISISGVSGNLPDRSVGLIMVREQC